MIDYVERIGNIFTPPDNMTVSEWADKYRVLDSRSSKMPGQWKTARVPYLREIMDSINRDEVEEIVVCAGVQSGKTETLFNFLGWAIHQTTFPIMIVYPTQDIAESISKNRIQPMIEKSILKDYMTDTAADFTKLEMKFKTTTVYFAWSNSPAMLASKPVCYLLFDEVDKYPSFSGREADPISLAKKRTTTFRGLRKILYVSTPTLNTGNIWKQLQSCNVIYRYYVPCPKCGHYQKLEFENIKWDSNDIEIIRDTAYYECEKCGYHIEELKKNDIIAKGKWVEDEINSKKRRKIGFHLSALYSPFVSFGEIAAEFLEAKDDPAKLMDFVNSRLAQPWAETIERKNEDDILKLRVNYEPGIIPKDTVALTMGIDTQKDGFYYVVHAWANDYTTLMTRYGYVATKDELAAIIFQSRYKVDGLDLQIPIIRAFMDSGGNRTAEVYEFCRQFGGDILIPIKGMSIRSGVPQKEGIIDKYPDTNKPIPGGLRLVSIDTEYYKDAIYRKMQIEDGKRGRWNVHNEIKPDYIVQMTAEEKRRIRNGNKYVEKWVQTRKDNHLLDCSVYAFAAADHIGVRFMQEVTKKQIAAMQPKRKKRIKTIESDSYVENF